MSNVEYDQIQRNAVRAARRRLSRKKAKDEAAWASLRETGLDYHCTVRSKSGEKVYFTLRELATSHKEAKKLKKRKKPCGVSVVGHSPGRCTLPENHRGLCWFPNMWNDQ